MAQTGKLKPLQIKRVKKPGRYADGGNLYLLVSPTGGKSWTFKYMIDGRGREMGLGPISDVPIEEARELATKFRRIKREGLDPITERRRELANERKDILFGDAAESFIAANADAWSNKKSPQQWRNTIRDYANPVLGKLLVRDIESSDVLRVLSPIWKTKTETAKRLRGRIEKVLDWAKVNGYREGENPATWKGQLEHSLAAPNKIRDIVHLASMPYRDVPAFVQALQGREGVSAKAVLFTILTAARSGEVRGAMWPEIDLEAAVWTIPKDRMKNGKEHRVPLTKPVIAMLESIKESSASEYVFPSSKPMRPLSDQGLTTVLRRMGIEKAQASIHGFRSSFRVWAEEKTQAPEMIKEMALSHYPSDEVLKAYQRSDLLDKRRELLNAWSAYCFAESTRNVIVANFEKAAS